MSPSVWKGEIKNCSWSIQSNTFAIPTRTSGSCELSTDWKRGSIEATTYPIGSEKRIETGIEVKLKPGAHLVCTFFNATLESSNADTRAVFRITDGDISISDKSFIVTSNVKLPVSLCGMTLAKGAQDVKRLAIQGLSLDGRVKMDSPIEWSVAELDQPIPLPTLVQPTVAPSETPKPKETSPGFYFSMGFVSAVIFIYLVFRLSRKGSGS